MTISPELRAALQSALMLKKPIHNRSQLVAVLKKRNPNLYSDRIFATSSQKIAQRLCCDGFCGGSLSRSYIVLRDNRRLCLTCAYYIVDYISLIARPREPTPEPTKPSYDLFLGKELEPKGLGEFLVRTLFGLSAGARSLAEARAKRHYDHAFQSYLAEKQRHAREKALFSTSLKARLWEEWNSYAKEVNAQWPGYAPDWNYRRDWVFAKYGKRCQRCGSKDHLVIHHIISVWNKRGSNSLENLVPLCEPCHRKVHGSPLLGAENPSSSFADFCKELSHLRFCPNCQAEISEPLVNSQKSDWAKWSVGTCPLCGCQMEQRAGHKRVRVALAPMVRF